MCYTSKAGPNIQAYGIPAIRITKKVAYMLYIAAIREATVGQSAFRPELHAIHSELRELQPAVHPSTN